jgi:protocatechuate 3,4-dioxygenase beta subunit
MTTAHDGSRRKVLQRVAGVGTLAMVAPWRSVLAALAATPAQTRGPFYPLTLPLDTDADLTMVKGANGRASGEIIQVAGRVLDSRGHPVRGATIELWQAIARGRYSHPRDINTAPLDPNFQGFARLTTDADGHYRFTSIKPGAYPMNPVNPVNIRPPHIHFDIAANGEHLVTQMYFPGDPLNERDAIFNGMGADKDAAIARVLDANGGAGAMQLGWDIVLAR